MKRLLYIESKSSINKLRDALNKAIPNRRGDRKQRFVFRNPTLRTFSAGVWYSMPLVFDIPKGYYNGHGIYADAATATPYMTLKANAATWNASNTLYDGLIASLIANEPILLRPAFYYQSTDAMNGSRLLPPQMCVTSTVQVSFDNRACAAESIAGAFRFDVDVLPGDSAIMEFNTPVYIGVYFDTPNAQFTQYPYYIDDIGRVAVYRRTTGQGDIHEPVRAMLLYNDDTTSRRNVPVNECNNKVIATIETPDYTGTDERDDFRKVLNLYYSPLTSITAKDYTPPGGDEVKKELYALPCLYAVEPFTFPNKIRQQYDFYAESYSSTSVADTIKDTNYNALLSDVKTIQATADRHYVFLGETLFQWDMAQKVNGVRQPYLRIVRQDEQRGDKGL